MLDSETILGLPFPVFEGGFTPWENQDDLLSFFQPNQDADQSPEPVNSNNSGSDEPSNQPPVSFSASAVDERKQRRMISNRESARRSRMRKQRHLEGLRNQMNRLRTENREIANRLGFVNHHCHLMRTDNDRLRSESVVLKQRLSDFRRILVLRQLQHQLLLSSPSPCNSLPSSSIYEVINEQQPPSLIA
ncbi:basic leucine zipper 4-like [Telopea speciosissima]|uniref:basic leucine zipper 4-like n=1 Tax=Telopea speciosissima TaxID=54955 RepID=UPI001CC361EF|nr:basic leucine zipper 4-like [Telopea speciosissima]